MERPRLLVFDLDGTLIDSSLDLCNSVNAAMLGVGKGTLPNAVIASYIGDGAAMLVRRALGDPGDVDAAAPRATHFFIARSICFWNTIASTSWTTRAVMTACLIPCERFASGIRSSRWLC